MNAQPLSSWYFFFTLCRYTANDLKHDSGHFYTATFSVVMPDTSTSDTIFFAYCYPYTYSDLKRSVVLNVEGVGRNACRNSLSAAFPVFP